MSAIDNKYAAKDDFDLVDELSKIANVEVPNAVNEIRNADIRHTKECDVDKMEDTVKEILGLEV